MNEKNLATIRRYYEGCNEADVEKMMSTFTKDVVHYFTGYSPVKGASELAKYWAKFQSGGRTTLWSVDHAISEGKEAVIEWTMKTTSAGEFTPAVLRGTEWYVFRDGKIAEIRAYYSWVHGVAVSQLEEFPYVERGYPATEAPPK